MIPGVGAPRYESRRSGHRGRATSETEKAGRTSASTRTIVLHGPPLAELGTHVKTYYASLDLGDYARRIAFQMLSARPAHAAAIPVDQIAAEARDGLGPNVRTCADPLRPNRWSTSCRYRTPARLRVAREPKICLFDVFDRPAYMTTWQTATRCWVERIEAHISTRMRAQR